MPSFKPIPLGQRFGKLLVVGPPTKEFGKEGYRYLCLCDCGGRNLHLGIQLRHGSASSCGCARKETLSKRQKTHGLSKSKLHVLWCGMRARCRNQKHISYQYYGAKGIKISSEFEKFEDFLAWAMKSGYCEGLTIERNDGRGDYSPENCVWATRIVQNRNSTHVHKVEFDGKNLCFTEWAEITGIKACTIKNRIRLGWTVERALTKGRTSPPQ